MSAALSWSPGAVLAVARLWEVRLGPEIAAYLRGIDATLEPFQGRFLVHGSRREVLEGSWPDDLVIIAFPDRERALGWYTSPAYQALLPLRLQSAECDVILTEAASPSHRSLNLLPALGLEG